ncbi:MAG: hypothetical protein V2I76_04315 [Roseobacter sp.]|jgi:hypothetical protein|nr:hypothetical protein [Roseobacter sp.]
MTQHDQSTDAALERLLAAARKTDEGLPDNLVQRVLADAEAFQPSSYAAKNRQSGWFLTFQGQLSRLGALGGMITASAVGLWMGMYPPEVLDDLGIVSGLVQGGDALGSLSEDAAEVSGFGWDLEGS